jgi:hypothetical protein
VREVIRKPAAAVELVPREGVLELELVAHARILSGLVPHGYSGDTVRATPPSALELPALPLEEWEPTLDTLHLWVQVVGKIRLATAPPRNHWWHVPLYVDVRGLTTRRMHTPEGLAFQIDLDFVDHRLVVRTSNGAMESFPLADGLSVAEFDASLHELLARVGADVEIREVPYGVPMTTPFPEDREHASYDAEAVERFWRILDWTDDVFEKFAGWSCAKTSPVHLFWHSLDLAVTRFSGRRAPSAPGAGPVTREAYSHEVVSFGFWAGDKKAREAYYYSYTAPEPAGLKKKPLRPDDAHWAGEGSPLALLPYESVRMAADSRAALLAFLESAYCGGSDLAGWDREGLTSSWCPDPPALNDLLKGVG